MILRMLYISTPFAQVLALREYSPPATLLNVSAHRVFGRPILLSPILTSHTDAACAHLRGSILCYMASSFPLEAVSYCHDVFRVGS